MPPLLPLKTLSGAGRPPLLRRSATLATPVPPAVAREHRRCLQSIFLTSQPASRDCRRIGGAFAYQGPCFASKVIHSTLTLLPGRNLHTRDPVLLLRIFFDTTANDPSFRK